jgi:hypothetical protein
MLLAFTVILEDERPEGDGTGLLGGGRRRLGS